MNNDKQSKNKNSNFWKENGLLIALYSVVGVLVVVALSMTFFMPSTPSNDELVSLEETYNVSNNLANSYKTQVSENATSEIGQAQGEELNKDVQSDKESTTSKNNENKINEQKVTPTSDTANDEAKANDMSLEVTKVTNEVVIFEDDQTLDEAQPAMSFTDTENSDLEEANEDNDETYTDVFTEGQKMLWPTNGEVVATYSSDVLVYDPTLEQYRTNDSIDIATEKGEDVFAAYDGVVKEVSKSVDQGNYVVIDHGDGWVTTYSQLNDSMKVSVGDEIKKGQQIGTVAEPANKSVLLGTHLDFKVTKNDESVDPLVLLEQ